MHGCGNDYVYVDCTKKMISDPVNTARFVSDRHFGIGSDGLILIGPSEKADFEMIMYNADGSRSEMCGNGIRCVGKYVFDHHLTDKTEIDVDTLAGVKHLSMTKGEDGTIEKIRVNMGSPEFKASRVPVIFPKDQMINEPMEVDGNLYHVTCLSVGNPHCVTFLSEDVRGLDLESIGPKFEHHDTFPNRVNAEFINVLDRTHLRMRVWERGTGETLACGTGACASAVAAVVNGFTDDTVDIALPGGHLQVTYDKNDNMIYLTGPAKEVFSGDIDIPEGFSHEGLDDVKIYHVK